MTISVGNLIVAGGATVDTSEVLSALNKQGLKVWVGTKTQRDALPENVKNDDKITFLTYDSEEDIYLIVDTIISYSKTWSSVKISTELAKKINSSDVYTKTEVMTLINSKVASALKYRGAVATVAALPSTGQENGDSYYVQADGYMYAWSSDYSDWQALGSATDMTNYYTKSEVDALLADMAVKFQYSTMPTADSTTVGKIIQYTGADTNDYKNGYWYKGIDNGDSTYSWSLHNIGDYYTKSEIDGNYIYHGFHQAGAGDTYVRLMIDNSSYLNGKFYCVDRSGNEYVITIKSGVPTSCYRPNAVSASTEYTKGIKYYTETVQKIHLYINNYQWDCLNYYFISDSGSKITKFDSNSTEYNDASAINWKKLTTTDEIAIKYDYTMTGTASLEDDIKTFVTALMALGTNTYVGFFNRSGSLGTAGNYSITVYAEEGTSIFASGYIALGAGAVGKTQYLVSYYKPTGSSEEWKIEKLVTASENNFAYKVLITDTDLNNIIASGAYSIYISDVASQATNHAPTYGWLQLVVVQMNNSDAYCQQILYRGDDAAFMRECSNHVWSEWKRFITESDLSTLLGATAVKVAGYSIESSYMKQGRVVTAQIQFCGGSTLGIQINDVLYTGFPQPDRGFQFSVYNTEFSEPIVFQLNEDGTVITKETISKDSTTIGMFSYISKY